MKNITKLMAVTIFLFIQTSFAVESRIILYMEDYPVTNLNIIERMLVETGYNSTYASPSMMKVVVERYLPFILSEYYASQNSITVTEQEVTNELTREAAKSGKNLEKHLKDSKPTADKTVEKIRKRWQKLYYDGQITKKVVRHYDSTVDDLNDADIQGFIDYYRKTCHPPKIGQREAVYYNYIVVMPEELAKDESLRKELDGIKNRLNKKEKFEDIAQEYSDRKEFIVSKEPMWLDPGELERNGLDAIVPWQSLKNKTTIITWQDAATAPPMLMQILDYRPNTRKEVGTAFKDKNLREEALRLAKQHKFGKVRRKMLKELKTKIRYVDDKKIMYEKLAEDYKNWQTD